MTIKEFLRRSHSKVGPAKVEMTAVWVEDDPTKRKIWGYPENSDVD